ncbi:hypothetical protein GCM10010981_36730 [Dyella nitratireducens]|uniref:Autotransporter domain-containing protein n=2 Tax=Dyella nitratireducens TaxID=1849580 RepID=A0ABQ1GIE3_9GAMM|nr:hypothetical protein GCM10010981_36730 [Dyella nitratireducens]GLQ41770.1 hypothetical protein GCM10007902_16200 [Dyella nitratireducens]
MLGVALAATAVDGHAQTTVDAPTSGGDITSLILGKGGADNVALQGGNYVINLPDGATTYSGIISGTGTLTIDSPNGASTLILTQTPTYALPAADQTQSTRYTYANYLPYTYDGLTSPNVFHGGVTVTQNPDPNSLTIGSNTTLQLGDATHNTVTLNNNVLDNGTLLLNEGSFANQGPIITLGGTVSGSGGITVLSKGFNGGVRLFGVNTYTGPSLFLWDGANVGTDHMYGSTPNTKFIFITTSYLPSTPVPVLGLPGQVDITQNIWEDRYENDINLDAYTGLTMFRGVYSYSDSGDENNPSLTNTKLNDTSLGGNASERGVNIEGSVVQFGDGTTSQMFINGNAYNTYINLHDGGILGFDYNGTVTLNTAIGGGKYLDSLSTPGVGDVVIRGNDSNANHVIFTQAEFYNGLTQIDAGTVLQLGDGTKGDASGTPGQVGYYESSGGNGSLLTADSVNGASTDRIADNGTLIIDNVPGADDGITVVSLSHIGGSGSLQQIGSLPLTLLADTTYTGTTTIAAGSMLYLGTDHAGVAASIASSSTVMLTGAGATLDMSQASAETLQDLVGAAGSVVALGSYPLTVGTTHSTVFAGSMVDGGIGGGTGGSLIKVGSGTLALSGANTYTGGTTIHGGVLQLGIGGTNGSVIGNIVDNATLAFDRSDLFTYGGTISGSGGVVQAGNGTTVLTADNSYTGTTTVSDGNLQLDGTLASDVAVESAGELSGTGEANSVTVTGTLHPGDAALAEATFKIARNLTFNTGSLFAVNVDANGGHSLLQVGGAAHLLGGNVSVTVANGSYAAKQEYLILSANGGVNGTFSSVLVNGLNLDPSLRYTGNDVYLDLVNPNATTSTSSSGASSSNPPSSSGGTLSTPSAPTTVVTVTPGAIPLFSCTQLTSNQCSVEHALQAASTQTATSLQPVLAALSQQPLPSARTALNSMGGEIYADADWLAAHQIANLRTLIDRHPLSNDRDPWVEYIDGDARVASDGNAMGLSAHNDGVFAGVDVPVDDQLQFGAFAGNTRSTATLANGAYATVSGPQAGLYARALLGKTGAWYGNAVVGVGNPKVAVYRLPNVGDIAYASGANYREHTVGLAAEFGYHTNVAGVDMRPFIAYDGGLARRSTIREVAAAPTDLAVQGRRTIASTATLGIHASRSLVTSSGLGVTPDFTVSAGRRLRQDGTVVDATLPAASDTAFSTQGVRTGRMLASASGGVRLRFTRNVSLSLDGTYAHARRENDRNVQARLNVTW